MGKFDIFYNNILSKTIAFRIFMEKVMGFMVKMLCQNQQYGIDLLGSTVELSMLGTFWALVEQSLVKPTKLW